MHQGAFGDGPQRLVSGAHTEHSGGAPRYLDVREKVVAPPRPECYDALSQKLGDLGRGALVAVTA
jgi:hypothetical protein